MCQWAVVGVETTPAKFVDFCMDALRGRFSRHSNRTYLRLRVLRLRYRRKYIIQRHISFGPLILSRKTAHKLQENVWLDRKLMGHYDRFGSK
jgi:hypothetical protein